MKRILLIRHGATAGNLRRCYIGRTDEPLCEQGMAQAERLWELGWTVDGLFVSPALRTRQTAQIVFPGMEQTIVDDLMETDFGKFEGKTADELSGDADYRTWVESGCTGPIPGGESPDDFKKRCCNAFAATVNKLSENSCAAFVIHGGGIMAILEAYASPPRSFYDCHIGNGEYVQCRFENNSLYIEKGAID